MDDTRGRARQHLGASLALYDALSRAGGGHPAAARVRRMLDRPDRLTATDEPFAMKYDGYLAAGTRAAWGFTVNSRFDGRALSEFLGEAIDAAGITNEAEVQRAATRLSAALPLPSVATLSFAFDDPGAPPRLKVYFQEDAWGAGVGSAREVDEALAAAELGCALPAWLDGAPSVGVVTLEAPPGRAPRAKAYVGAASLEGAFAGAPEDVRSLADQMAAACPLASTYYYLTVRLERGEAPRYAVNKIYDLARQRFGADQRATLEAFRDVSGLFRAAGRTKELRAVLSELRRPDAHQRIPRVIPTASAIEDGGRSVDFYCAAFALDPDGGRARVPA
ncbi:MAG: hypothetical protein R3B40_15145 [Polyangiales bacterium]|nr:hypothetical protein [Myxococcales bacterium]